VMGDRNVSLLVNKTGFSIYLQLAANLSFGI
jgi:hypothetical protein